jgi:hypothetical protein
VTNTVLPALTAFTATVLPGLAPSRDFHQILRKNVLSLSNQFIKTIENIDDRLKSRLQQVFQIVAAVLRD